MHLRPRAEALRAIARGWRGARSPMSLLKLPRFTPLSPL